MQLTSERRIFEVTNYLRTRNFKEVQQLFKQRFRDSFRLKWQFRKMLKSTRQDRSFSSILRIRPQCDGNTNISLLVITIRLKSR